MKKNNLANGWESFECERGRNYRGCAGKVRMQGNNIQITKEHTHAPDPARNEALKATATMRQRAQTTLDGTQAILGDGLMPETRSFDGTVVTKIELLCSLHKKN